MIGLCVTSRNMRIFITGAAGFVGASVVRHALAAGADVGVLVTPGKTPYRLMTVLERIRVFKGNLEDTEQTYRYVQEFKPDTCIHLAWYAEPGKYLTSPENLKSLKMSIDLLQLLIKVGCQHVVMVGTCAEYDTDVGYLHEYSPTKPTTIYAATKLSMQLIGQQSRDQIGFTWARLFYMYGPYEDERRLTPALIKSLLEGKTFAATPGEQIRDYLHIDDVASGLLLLAQQGLGGVFNISSGNPVSIRQFMQTTAEFTGHNDLIRFGALPYRVWEPMFICGNNQKLKQAGWNPQYTLTSGLAQTVNWWIQQNAK